MILILFVLYINDLHDLLRNACKLYAGDSKIIAILRNIITPKLLQRDIDLVTSRTNDWMMQLNTGKCSFMHFGGRSGNSCVGSLHSLRIANFHIWARSWGPSIVRSALESACWCNRVKSKQSPWNLDETIHEPSRLVT